MTETRITALVLTVDSAGPPQPVRIDADADGYGKLVGGWLEAVYGTTPDGELVVLYINEEGRIHGLPVNPTATLLWHRLNPDAAPQTLLGDVVVVGARGPADADIPAGAVDAAQLAYADWERVRLSRSSD